MNEKIKFEKIKVNMEIFFQKFTNFITESIIK